MPSLKVIVWPGLTRKLAMSVFTPSTLHVAMRDDLAGRPDRAADAEATQHVVEPRLQKLRERVGGVALALLGHVHVAAELALQHAIVMAELLLFVEAHAVLGIAPAAIAVHAGELKFLGGVLGDVGNGNTDATRQLNLRAEITGHGRNSFSR